MDTSSISDSQSSAPVTQAASSSLQPDQPSSSNSVEETAPPTKGRTALPGGPEGQRNEKRCRMDSPQPALTLTPPTTVATSPEDGNISTPPTASQLDDPEYEVEERMQDPPVVSRDQTAGSSEQTGANFAPLIQMAAPQPSPQAQPASQPSGSTQTMVEADPEKIAYTHVILPGADQGHPILVQAPRNCFQALDRDFPTILNRPDARVQQAVDAWLPCLQAMGLQRNVFPRISVKGRLPNTVKWPSNDQPSWAFLSYVLIAVSPKGKLKLHHIYNLIMTWCPTINANNHTCRHQLTNSDAIRKIPDKKSKTNHWWRLAFLDEPKQERQTRVAKKEKEPKAKTTRGKKEKQKHKEVEDEEDEEDYADYADYEDEEERSPGNTQSFPPVNGPRSSIRNAPRQTAKPTSEAPTDDNAAEASGSTSTNRPQRTRKRTARYEESNDDAASRRPAKRLRSPQTASQLEAFGALDSDDEDELHKTPPAAAQARSSEPTSEPKTARTISSEVRRSVQRQGLYGAAFDSVEHLLRPIDDPRRSKRRKDFVEALEKARDIPGPEAAASPAENAEDIPGPKTAASLAAARKKWARTTAELQSNEPSGDNFFHSGARRVVGAEGPSIIGNAQAWALYRAREALVEEEARVRKELADKEAEIARFNGRWTEPPLRKDKKGDKEAFKICERKQSEKDQIRPYSAQKHRELDEGVPPLLAPLQFPPQSAGQSAEKPFPEPLQPPVDTTFSRDSLLKRFLTKADGSTAEFKLQANQKWTIKDPWGEIFKVANDREIKCEGRRQNKEGCKLDSVECEDCQQRTENRRIAAIHMQKDWELEPYPRFDRQ